MLLFDVLTIDLVFAVIVITLIFLYSAEKKYHLLIEKSRLEMQIIQLDPKRVIKAKLMKDSAKSQKCFQKQAPRFGYKSAKRCYNSRRMFGSPTDYSMLISERGPLNYEIECAWRIL